MVSSSFVGSDYCYDIEVSRALDRYENGDVILVPIIVRQCDWNESPLGQIQALPKNAEPISMWADRDTGWFDVVKGLKARISSFQPLTTDLVVKANVKSDVKSGSEVSTTHKQWLEDTEVVFTHRMVDRLKISDIYTWPDLKFLTDVGRKGLDYVSSKNLLKNRGYHLVLGEEQQGKTALLKYLFQCFIGENSTPLYIDAKSIKKSDLELLITHALNDQYESVSHEEFIKNDNKVLLIDNFDQIGLNQKYQSKLLEQVNKVFDYVILTAHESYSLVLTENQELNDYELSEILGFGHLKREEMVIKWISLGVEESIDESELYESCSHLQSQLNTIFKKI